MSQPQSAKPDLIHHPKVTHLHRQRLAYIYVRQSTLKQVNRNQESQHYQYRLRQRALELGWAEERVRVIDSDLGQSGREADARVGFQELVAQVSLGHVGIVFGYQVSRIARNNRDWYHLLDLAAMFGTLIADTDGIYDPRLYNDRLLLGLKGTMSEAELYMLRQRLDEGRLTQVKRGAYRQRLPTGLVRLPDGTVVKEPDDQVRHVIELVFAQFELLGSVNKVIRYLRRHKILLPRRQSGGPQAGQLLWKVASEAAVSDMLQNPAYAGAFAHGRRQIDPARRQPGRPAAGRVRKPMSEWIHLQHDVYPAYITWEQYLANQERIRQNGLRFVENRQKAQGIVREGPGLLQGMVVCGHCAHHMQTVYKHTPRYVCRGQTRTTDVGPSDCNSVRAPVVDEVVVQAFFEAIQPAHLDALEAILAAQQQERQRLERQWQEQLKRAEYEVALAQRQYDAVDPQNRLVAAELERRWEEKLAQLQQTQEDYTHFQQTPLPDTVPPQLREQFREVSDKLPQLWPTLSNAQKKELLRSLINQVIVKRPVPDRIEIRIVWISGCYTDQTTLTPIHRDQDISGYEEMVERVRELWQQGYNDEQMAAQLTIEGFHSARSPHVTPSSVLKIRLARQWFLPLAQMRQVEAVEGYFTARGLANQLAINNSTVYRFIYKQAIPPEYIKREPQSGVYLIRQDEQLIEQLRQRVTRQKQRKGMLKPMNPPPADDPAQKGGSDA
jgi:DNA invertase Pin-like site-specific DNA recombinase